MTTYNTGNSIGSADPRDLHDNAQVVDDYANSDAATTTDRLGVERRTLAGMEQEHQDDQTRREGEHAADQSSRAAQYQAAESARNLQLNEFIANHGSYTFIGSYASGIEITEYNQVVRDTNGEFWRVSGTTDLPYTTTGVGLPEGGAFVTVGDAALRQDLADPAQGGELVQVTTSTGAQPLAGALDDRVPVSDLDKVHALNLVDRFLNKLKAASIFERLDALYLPFLPDAELAARDWATGNYPLTPMGNIKHLPLVGYHGTGQSGDWVDTGFGKSDRVNWEDDDCHIMAWAMAPTDRGAGIGRSSFNEIVGMSNLNGLVRMRQVNFDHKFDIAINVAGSNPVEPAVALADSQTHLKFYLANYSSGLAQGFIDGAPADNPVAAAFNQGGASTEGTVALLRWSANHSNHTVGAVSFGGSLTESQVKTFYSELRVLMLSLGADLVEPEDEADGKIKALAHRKAPFKAKTAPTLDIDFANGGLSSSLISLTQAGNLWEARGDGTFAKASSLRPAYQPYTGERIGVLSERSPETKMPASGFSPSDDLTNINYNKTGVTVSYEPPTSPETDLGVDVSVVTPTGTDEHYVEANYGNLSEKYGRFQLFFRKGEGIGNIAIEIDKRDGTTESVSYRSASWQTALSARTAGIIEASITPLTYWKGWVRISMLVDLGEGEGDVISRLRYIDPDHDVTDINYPLGYEADGSSISGVVSGWDFAVHNSSSYLPPSSYRKIATEGDEVNSYERITLDLPNNLSDAKELTVLVEGYYLHGATRSQHSALIDIVSSDNTSLLRAQTGGNSGDEVGKGRFLFFPQSGTNRFFEREDEGAEYYEPFSMLLAFKADRFYYGAAGNDVRNSESSDDVSITATPARIGLGWRPSNPLQRSIIPLAFSRIRVWDKVLPPSDMRALVGSRLGTMTDRQYNFMPVYPAIDISDPPWMRVARSQLGIAQYSEGHNPEVLKFHATGWTVFNRLSTVDTVDWCNHFVDWCLEQSGLNSMGSIKAASQQWQGRKTEPRYGAIVMISPDPGGDEFNNNPLTALSGISHVAFYAGDDPDNSENFMMLGGNQSNRVTLTSRPKSRIVDLRWPDYRMIV